MFVNQHGGVKMALYSHDMTFLRKHERTRLFKTFKWTHMYFCMSEFWCIRNKYRDRDKQKQEIHTQHFKSKQDFSNDAINSNVKNPK